MLDATIATELTPSANAWTVDGGRHGMVAALAAAEARGDDAATAWYRERESLPRHRIHNCSMIEAMVAADERRQSLVA